MGLSHKPICFRGKRWFPSKIAKFSHPRVFTPPLTGFPLKLVIGARIQKALRETQTLRAGCSKAETKKKSPRRRPPSRYARDGQNLINWRWSLSSPTNRVWWGSMHAISSYRGNRPTHTLTHSPTHTHTQRQDRLQYTATAPQLARSVTRMMGLPDGQIS